MLSFSVIGSTVYGGLSAVYGGKKQETKKNLFLLYLWIEENKVQYNRI
jgi:hypothetical protein